MHMEKLFLGVAREIITPPLGAQLYGYRPDVFADALADDLTATAFYFRQGSVQALMISFTLCEMQTELCSRILDLLEKETSIPKECILLSSTHTHSGPNTTGDEGWGDIDLNYCEGILIPRLLSVAKEAMKAPVPVQMGMAQRESKVGINRRQIEGRGVTLGQNPWGCFDPAMTVLSFRDEEGKTVANMIHYGCHGTAAGRCTIISRDWPGVMTDTLERETGAVTAFFNGTEGDVGPRLSNGKTVGNMDYVQQLGHIAGRDAVEVFRDIRGYHTPVLSAGTRENRIPLKKRMPLEEARALYEKYKENTVNLQGKLRMHALEVMAAWEKGEEEKSFESFPQTAIRLGDAVFLSFPYEVFSEIGLRIRSLCPRQQVLSLSVTNGCKGYFATESQLCMGGYEALMFQYGRIQPFCDFADWELIQESVKTVQALFENERS